MQCMGMANWSAFIPRCPAVLRSWDRAVQVGLADGDDRYLTRDPDIAIAIKRYRRSLFLMNAVASSTSIRPMGPDAYMEPRTIPRRNRNSVGCT